MISWRCNLWQSAPSSPVAPGYSLVMLRHCLVLVCVCTLPFLLGCGAKKAKLVPVSGKVTIDGKALPGGQVTYHPESTKGSKGLGLITGAIDADGSYTLTSDGKQGAPLGKYKVRVATMIPGGNPNPVEIDKKFTDPETSGLTVEVVENAPPGKYDLKVTK